MILWNSVPFLVNVSTTIVTDVIMIITISQHMADISHWRDAMRMWELEKERTHLPETEPERERKREREREREAHTCYRVRERERERSGEGGGGGGGGQRANGRLMNRERGRPCWHEKLSGVSSIGKFDDPCIFSSWQQVFPEHLNLRTSWPESPCLHNDLFSPGG